MIPIRLAAVTVAGALFASSQSAAPPKPDVIYVPTPQVDVVYDLGSGDGRIVITAATKYGARGVGIEIDPELVQAATDAARAAGVSDRVRFVNENLFTANINEATVVTLYLLQSINERLRPKLIRELQPGTRVVSHVFNMGPEWPPQKELMAGPNRIFLWT